MALCLRIVLLLFLVPATLTQDMGFDLADALDDIANPLSDEGDSEMWMKVPEKGTPTPAKPKEQPKAPEKPKTDGGLDLFDAFGTVKPTVKPPAEKPKKPSSGDSGGDGFVLLDALGPDSKTDKPPVKPPQGGGGGGSFDDSDLFDVSGGEYKPDGGRPGGGGAVDPDYNSQGGADQPQEAGSGQIAGIASAIGVALLGAASSYFAYQKKKLCFKLQGGADPESGKGPRGNQSDPQVFSNLLRTS